LAKKEVPFGVKPVMERTLEQLNKTQTLWKKVEASNQNETILEKYAIDKEHI
jgi:hypothetical protein